MKQIGIFIIAAVMLLFSVSATAETPSRSFDLPEEALLFFARSIAEGNFEAALSAMDAQASAEHGDYQALVERTGAIIPSSFLMAPDYPSFIPLNENRLRALQSHQFYGFVFSLLLPEMASYIDSPMIIRDGLIKFPNDVGSMPLQDYMDRLNPQNLSSLSLRQVFMMNKPIYHNESYQENIRKQGAIYGFSEQKDFVAVYELDDQLFLHTCTAVKRPDGWQLSSLNSIITGAHASGIAQPIPQEEVAALLDSSDYVLLYDKAFN